MKSPRPTPGNTQWFVQSRFGMFIHWGLYSLGARHEWMQNFEERPPDEYASRYFPRFDPDLFDPKGWARAARAAGMKYFVVTAKHHEGFCMWDTAQTDFKATNTPAKRDLLREIIDAFRAEGLRIGIYYSLIDWHHPQFTIDVNHPLKNHPEAAKLNAGRNMREYAEYMRAQVRELLTGYGPIDIMWFDFSYPNHVHKGLPGKGRNDWESEKLYALVRELAPKVILDNRLDLESGHDIVTPEQYQPLEGPSDADGNPVVWEACQTLSGSWGYHRDENTWKSPEQLVQMLVDTVSKGGNLLMNVGPTARGFFDQRSLTALSVYGEWMKWNNRSIYGCGQSDFKAPTDVRYTQNFQTNRLYVHLFAWPFRQLHLPGLAGKVAYGQFLHDGSELILRETTPENVNLEGEVTPGSLRIDLPVLKPNFVVPVLELFLK